MKHHRETLFATTLALLLLASACAPAPQSPDDDSTSGASATTYTVRGQVLSLPEKPGGSIRIAHEVIPDLLDASGEVVGMDAMTMSFTLAVEAGGETIEVGDKIEFDLRVDWEADLLTLVTRVEEIHEETVPVVE